MRKYNNTIFMFISVWLMVSAIFCSLLFLNDLSSKKRLIKQVVQIIKRPLKNGDLRQVIYILESVREDNFSFIRIFYDGRQILTLPSSKKFLEKRYHDILQKEDISFENNSDTLVGNIIFAYSWRDRVIYGLLMSSFLSILLYLLMRRYINIRILKKSEAESKIIFAKIATQVAHDIRSPLAALDMAAKTAMDGSGFNEVVFNSAINRIRDLANELLNNKKKENTSKKDQVEKVSICSMASTIVSEKRLEYSSLDNVNIQFNILENGHNSFSNIKKREISRALSNLINNSVEARDEKGININVSVSSDESTVNLIIKDNGKGIPVEYLKKVFERGKSVGKSGGNGLGLSHAKETIEEFGGEFNLDSSVGIGIRKCNF